MSLTGWIKRRTFSPPKNLLGADLFWWQETGDLHTLISIHAPVMPAGDAPQISITFVLFDRAGVPRTSWQRDILADETIVIDSALVHRTAGVADLPEEGTLAAFVSSKQPVGDRAARHYNRLYSLVDWYSDGGELVSLHNDQSVTAGDAAIEFTEIAFLETDRDKNFLVVINGNVAQAADSIALTVKNHHGQTRTARYRPAMKPFSLHKLHLAELFPDLREFCDDEHACLSGEFKCRGLFVRPYVMTRGSHLSGYHGGDRYASMKGLSRSRYEQLGRGEVNPMAVVNTDKVRTFVNIFNTHGSIEDDFWVDARVYDQTGTLVADKPRWLLATRNQLARGDVAELLPAANKTLIGHIALSFSPDDKPFYPGRLQALLEYRTEHNTSRVMAWSDEWNSPERQKRAAPVLRAFYRMWFKGPIVSSISITNSGLSVDYDKHVQYTIRLRNTDGETLRYKGTLAPQATDFGTIDTFFPGIEAFLGGSPAAMAVVESTSDLAIVQFTHHKESDVFSAEHFMALRTYHDGGFCLPCGS